MTAAKEQVKEAIHHLVNIGEDALRAEIAALDKRIKKQQTHIDKLQTELAEKKAERTKLVRDRIELLKKELPEDDAPEGEI